MLIPRSRNTDNHVGCRSVCPGVGELLIEVKVEMADKDLVAGYRLIDVVMCEVHDRLLCGPAVVSTEIEVHRHALHRSRRRVVKREVIQVPS